MSQKQSQQVSVRTLPESIQELTAAVARVRELRPQLMLLSDLRFGSSILEPQKSALPFAVTPEWPVPAKDADLTKYAEACCQRWLRGTQRLIDPHRPYFLCGFGQSCSMAFEIGQQMSLSGQRPTAVILIGANEGRSPLPTSPLLRVWDAAVQKLWALRELWRKSELEGQHRQDDLTIQKAIQGADPQLTEWARRTLVGQKRKGVELAPFPVFELEGSVSARGSSWVEERRCRIRGEGRAINVRRSPEVNAFLLKILLAPVPAGLQLAREQAAASRAASATLEEVARQIEEAQAAEHQPV